MNADDGHVGIPGPRLQQLLDLCYANRSKKRNAETLKQQAFRHEVHRTLWGTWGTGKPSFLEVICQYDCKQQAGDSYGHPGLDVRPQPAHHDGPVRALITGYSKRTSPAIASPDSHFPDTKEDQAPVTNVSEIITLLEDFDVVPNLVGRATVTAAFNKVQATHTGCTSSGAPNPHPHDIRMSAVADVLILVALEASSQHLSQEVPATHEKKLQAFISMMNLGCGQTRELSKHIADLERNSQKRGPKRKQLVWQYVDVQGQTVRSRVTTGSAPSPAEMGQLRRSFAKADRVAAAAYIPRWRAFDSPMLDFGVAVVGQVLHHRIVLHNRGVHMARLEIKVRSAPFLTISHIEQPLAPSLPYVQNVTATFDTVGEWVGEIILTTYPMLDAHGADALETQTLPVYAKCIMNCSTTFPSDHSEGAEDVT